MIRTHQIEPTARESASRPKSRTRAEADWDARRLGALGVAAVFAVAVISWVIDFGRGAHRGAAGNPDAVAVKTLRPVPDLVEKPNVVTPPEAAPAPKVNHADCEPVIAQFEESLRRLEREQCENLGTFQIAGRSTLFLLFRRMGDAERRQLIEAEMAKLSRFPQADRDHISTTLERLANQYLRFPGALRIFSVTGPGKRDEPMEMSMWDIESESNFGLTDSGFPSWRSGPTGGWTAVIDSSLRARYGHLFALEDEHG